MKEGKKSLFIILSVFFVTLFGFVAEVQAKPHIRHSVKHTAISQSETPEWDIWQGYTYQSAANRKSRPVASAYEQTNNGWSYSGIMSTAKSMLGMSEHGNRAALARTLGVDPVRTPWCAAWLNSVLKRSGHRSSGANTARSFYNYGHRSNGQIGDIAVMPHHTGLVAGYKVKNGRRYVGVLGGNTSNRVKTAWYPASRIAFRSPS